MSDIRQSNNVRLNRGLNAPDNQTEADRAAEELANNTHSSGTSRLGATTTTGTTHAQAPVALDTSERSNGDRTAAVTGRGGDGAAAPATTPLSRLGGVAADPNAGARSFISNLHSLDFHHSNDSDSMTASFLKLESTNMSTNQNIESYLNQAKHYLREAAFKIDRALENANPDALLQQADQLEQQAAAMVHQAMEDSGQAGGQIDQIIDAMQNGGDATDAMSTEQVHDVWMHVYDSADRAIKEAATASQEEKDALARGDTAGAKAARDRSDAAEDRARQMLSAGGIEVSLADGQAIGKLALKMKAEGDNGNVMDRFLELNPDKAQKLLTPEEWASVKGKGGAAIRDAIMTHNAATMDPMAMDSIGLAMNAADQQGIADAMNEIPGAAGIQGALQGAAALLAEAYDLRVRAFAIKEAQLDAANAIHEGKTDDGQFGVARRNAVAQNQIMRDFARLTGGSRPDMQAREDANMEARRSRPQVVQLLQDMIEHDSRTQLARHNHSVRT